VKGNERKGGGGGRKGKERKIEVVRLTRCGERIVIHAQAQEEKSRASQTQIAKNVAISPNAGGRITGPPRYAWRAAWCGKTLAFGLPALMRLLSSSGAGNSPHVLIRIAIIIGQRRRLI
jgi:hypothetical protein